MLIVFDLSVETAVLTKQSVHNESDLLQTSHTFFFLKKGVGGGSPITSSYLSGSGQIKGKMITKYKKK